MDYEYFKTIIEESLDGLSSYASWYSGDGHDGFELKDEKIVQTHVSHGYEGGNCWGDEARYFSNPKMPDDFIPLDYILEQAAPNISYLRYKEIQKMIKESTKSHSEYYGNSVSYLIYTLDIRKLYDFLFSGE